MFSGEIYEVSLGHVETGIWHTQNGLNQFPVDIPLGDKVQIRAIGRNTGPRAMMTLTAILYDGDNVERIKEQRTMILDPAEGFTWIQTWVTQTATVDKTGSWTFYCRLDAFHAPL